MSLHQGCHKHDRLERISLAGSRERGPRLPGPQVVCFPEERVWLGSVPAMRGERKR